MPQFKVYGTDKSTGKEVKGLIEADDARTAREKASRKIEVAKVLAMGVASAMASRPPAEPPVQTVIEPVRYAQPQPQAQPAVVVNNTVSVNTRGTSSQALPALANVFLPGLGQLIQGRVLAWIMWMFVLPVVLVVVAVVTFGIGLVLVPIYWIACIVDAARYKG